MGTTNKEKMPNNAKAWSNRGVALSKLGKVEEALESFERALELDPNDPEIWYNRGVAMDKLGRIEEALESFEVSTILNSNDPEVWCNKGIALFKLSRFIESLKSFEKAIEINPNYKKALYNKKVVLNKLRRHKETPKRKEKNHQKANEKVLGIDLGAFNSVAAIYEGGQAKVILSAEGPTMEGKMFPSVVAFTKDSQLLVGESAKRQASTNIEGTVCEIQRKMGTDFKVNVFGRVYAPGYLSVHFAEN